MRLAILNPGAAFQRRAIVQNENDCIITPDNVDDLPQTHTLISNFGGHALNAHELTIITGTECARTALFAKMLAATALSGGKYPFAENMYSNIENPRVLWLDSVTPFHAASQFTRDMKQHFNATADNFRFVALNALGSDQDFCGTVKEILNNVMKDFRPNLLIINDLDHLFPSATWLFCRNFVEFLKDYVNMHDAAVCAIGHNLIGKIKKTSGYVGEIMLPDAGTIYRVSERSKKESAVTRVSCYKNSLKAPQDFSFIVNDLNFPQQLPATQEPTNTPTPPPPGGRCPKGGGGGVISRGQGALIPSNKSIPSVSSVPSAPSAPSINPIETINTIDSIESARLPQPPLPQPNTKSVNKILTFPPKNFSRHYRHPQPLLKRLKHLLPLPPTDRDVQVLRAASS